MNRCYQMVPLTSEVRIQEVLRIFQANPAYFKLTSGAAADRSDVLEAMTQKPEQAMAENKHTRLIQRFMGDAAESVAVVDWLDDFPESGIRYLGLFMTDASLHGTGVSREILEWLLEDFRQGGTRAVRLGVIAENERALRFWKRAGFSEVRRVAHTRGELAHEVVIMDLTLSHKKEDETDPVRK